MLDTIIKNVHIVLGKEILYGSVGIAGDKIHSITEGKCNQEASLVIDGRGKYLIPGGVDPHVHIRYPGIDHRESFWTGSCAAAAGGTTTILEHPISSPPQYNQEILEVRAASAMEQSIVDIGFLGASGGEHLDEIVPLSKAGIFGYKTFLHDAPEGREKEFTGLTSKTSYELYRVLQEIGKTGLLAAAHTEDNEMVAGGIEALRNQGRTDPLAHCESRPPIVEVLAVQRLISLARETGTRVYLVHLSTPQAVELALKAKEDGLEIYLETCPHYLFMDESYLSRFGAYAKCNPPLRERGLVDQMWEHVESGAIDVLASDHAPYTVEEKERCGPDIFKAPAGFPGLETRLSFLLTAVAQKRISLHRAVELFSTNPARIFGIQDKGEIKVGYDADLVLIDIDQPRILTHKDFKTKASEICKLYDGVTVYGEIEKTILRGNVIFDSGEIVAESGYGKWLK